jgi:hypothetical protein
MGIVYHFIIFTIILGLMKVEKIINKKGVKQMYAVKEASNCKPYKNVFTMVKKSSSFVFSK